MKLLEVLPFQFSISQYLARTPQNFSMTNLSRVQVGQWDESTNTYTGVCSFKEETKINSWQGCPSLFVGGFGRKGTLELTNTDLVSFDPHCKIQKADFIILTNGWKSYKGIQQHIQNCTELEIDMTASNMLGVLLIDGLQVLRVRRLNGPANAQQAAIQQIMRKHLATRDIHACQEELIDAGFIQQARL